MKVLVGVDESEYSTAAIRYITEAAWPERTAFLVLSAAEPIFFGPGEAAAADSISVLMQEQETYHQRTADGAAAQLRKNGLFAEGRMMRGDPRAVDQGQVTSAGHGALART